jgi:hypothetical protein
VSGDLERDRQQSVASQDRDAVAENFVTGGTTAAQIVVVHAREIIVNERIGVDAFHGTSMRQSGARFSTARFGRRETENWPEPFSPGKQTVAHRTMNRDRRHRRFGQETIEGAIDFLLPRDKVAFQVHGRRLILRSAR